MAETVQSFTDDEFLNLAYLHRPGRKASDRERGNSQRLITISGSPAG